MGFASSTNQKQFKQAEHSRERSAVRNLLKTGQYEVLPHPKKYGNEWDSPRDGKQYFGLENSLQYYYLWQYKKSIKQYLIERKKDYRKWMSK